MISVRPTLELLEKMTREQLQVIQGPRQGMAVLAGAGTGKTTTLIAKCAWQIRQNPKAEIAAISFTERSASDLRKRFFALISDNGSDPWAESLAIRFDHDNHWISTIHGLCRKVIRDYPAGVGLQGDESLLSEAQAQLLWEESVESLWDDQKNAAIIIPLESFLRRESFSALQGLLLRCRDLFGFGVLEALRNSGDPFSKWLAVIFDWVKESYDKKKRRGEVLDFQDLENFALKILESQKVQSAFQNRFDLVLVDEFQDTNLIQCKIIEKIARPDFSNLCIVGDPKQSIYRFRGAEVRVFEEFCKKLPTQVSLTGNFRSHPEILSFVNTVCEPLFTQTRYSPLQAKGIHFASSTSGSDKFSAVQKLVVKNEGELAQWIVEEIKKKIPASSMALLLRKIKGNEKWIRAISSQGIPVALGSGGFFWDDPRVREMVAFLKWWDNPGNLLSGLVFLRAPWVGIIDQQLADWIEQCRQETSEEHLVGLTLWEKFLLSENKLGVELLQWRDGILSPGELLLKLLNPETQKEIGVPLLGLWHRAEEFSHSGLNFHRVVLSFTKRVQEGKREKELPPPRNQGSLQVLTLHASKGLEFEHVILVDFGKKSKAPNSPLLYWDFEKGVFLSDRNSQIPTAQGNEKIWQSGERSKNLEESKRLFYVALTRAKQRLVLVCPEIPESEVKGEDESVDYWRAWIERE